MQSRDVLTRERQVWLTYFNRAYSAWLASGFTDRPALEWAAKSLKSLFERCPDLPLVGQLALFMSYLTHVVAAPPALIIAFAQIGLEAVIASSDTSAEQSLRKALLALGLAQGYLADEQRLAGLDALRRIDREAETLPAQHPMTAYVKASQAFLRASLHEAGLEVEQAAPAFEAAAQICAPLLEDAAITAAFPSAWLDLMLGRDELGVLEPRAPEIEALLHPLVRQELVTLYVSSRLGRVRSDTCERDPARLSTFVHEARRVIPQEGLPPRISLVDLAATVTHLADVFSLSEADAFTQTLLQIAPVEEGEPQAEWRALLRAALLRVYAAHPDADAQSLQQQAIEDIEQCEDALVQALAYGHLLVARSQGDNQGLDQLLTKFLAALNTLAATHSFSLFSLRQLRLKALFDEPIGVAIESAFQRWLANPAVGQRLYLSALLDVLRQPHWSLVPFVETLEATEADPAWYGYLQSLDRLQRIHYALTQLPDTAVIILQTLGQRVLFLCLTGDPAQPILHDFAANRYRDLAQAAEDEFQDVTTGGSQGDGLRPVAERIFATLPPQVQALVRQHHTLFFIPDFRTNEDDVPFELLHDGTAYLGTSKIMARLTSLWHAVRVLERSERRVDRQRAIVFAVPDPAVNDPNLPPLPSAQPEAEMVQTLWTQRGWDVPAVGEDRLSTTFLIDRLEYLSLLHIAAHGESNAGGEALLLPYGQRFVTDDLLRKPLSRLPFVYLNTCWLGKTRYLGGGVSRGIPYALVEAGAPAVIANLSPVADITASKLSREFHQRAPGLSVGEALRQARLRMFHAGISPVLWGTTVLLGDPTYSLPITDPTRTGEHPDLVHDLLDAFMTLQPDRDRYQTLYYQAYDTAQDHPEDARLQAALDLIHSASTLPAKERRINKLLKKISEMPVLRWVLSGWFDKAPKPAAMLPANLDTLELSILTAEQLNHLPGMALLRAIQADYAWETEDADAKWATVESTLAVLEPLAHLDKAWQPLHQDFLSKWQILQMAKRGQRPGRDIRKGEEDDDIDETIKRFWDDPDVSLPGQEDIKSGKKNRSQKDIKFRRKKRRN